MQDFKSKISKTLPRQSVKNNENLMQEILDNWEISL